MPDGLITAVEVATIRSPLPVTINFGPWVMDEPGLGPRANPAWIAEQIVDDPDGVVERLA